MWTRRQLKERARASFYRNRWKTILVSLVIMVLLAAAGCAASIGGGILGDLRPNTMEDTSGYMNAPKAEDMPQMGEGEDAGSDFNSLLPDGRPGGDDSDMDSDTQGGFGAESYYVPSRGISAKEYAPSGVTTFSVVIIVLLILGSLVVVAFLLAVVALIVNPLIVGCRRFFFINLNVQARVGELGYGFDTEYKNIAETMFYKTIYTALWSLLFVVPGIVKNYEYMMVPYILTEEPGIDRKRAFTISKEMMQGNKWKAFVLDLSFIPWNLLSSITCGIVGVFYVEPYKNMTHAAFYEQMRSEYTQRRMARAQEPEGAGYQQTNTQASDTARAQEPEGAGYQQANTQASDTARAQEPEGAGYQQANTQASDMAGTQGE